MIIVITLQVILLQEDNLWHKFHTDNLYWGAKDASLNIAWQLTVTQILDSNGSLGCVVYPNEELCFEQLVIVSLLMCCVSFSEHLPMNCFWWSNRRWGSILWNAFKCKSNIWMYHWPSPLKGNSFYSHGFSLGVLPMAVSMKFPFSICWESGQYCCIHDFCLFLLFFSPPFSVLEDILSFFALFFSGVLSTTFGSHHIYFFIFIYIVVETTSLFFPFLFFIF